jgi:hypothetical protein
MESVKNSTDLKDIMLMFSTTQLLLAQVSLFMDKSELDKNRFRPNFRIYPINCMIERIVDIFR